MVLTYIVHFELNEASASQAGEVAKRLVEFAEKYRKDEGTLDWIVSQDAKNPTHFALLERYTSKAAIKTHAANPIFPKFGAYLKPFLKAPPKLVLYQEVEGKL